MSKQKYLVIIGDIVKSREIQDRQNFQHYFAKSLDPVEIQKTLSIEEIFGADVKIISRFTVTIGDELQGVLNNANNIFKFLNSFEHSLQRHMKERHRIKFRYGIGIGEISTKINKEAAIGMDGPAFYNARESLSEAKKNNLMYCFKSSSLKDTLINTLLLWINSESADWNFTKFQLVNLYRDGWAQKQIADSLNISQPAVSKALKSVNADLIIHTEKMIENEINKILKD